MAVRLPDGSGPCGDVFLLLLGAAGNAQTLDFQILVHELSEQDRRLALVELFGRAGQVHFLPASVQDPFAATGSFERESLAPELPAGPDVGNLDNSLLGPEIGSGTSVIYRGSTEQPEEGGEGEGSETTGQETPDRPSKHPFGKKSSEEADRRESEAAARRRGPAPAPTDAALEVLLEAGPVADAAEHS